MQLKIAISFFCIKDVTQYAIRAVALKKTIKILEEKDINKKLLNVSFKVWPSVLFVESGICFFSKKCIKF